MIKTRTVEEQRRRIKIAIKHSRTIKYNAIIHAKNIHIEIVKCIRIHGQIDHTKERNILESMIRELPANNNYNIQSTFNSTEEESKVVVNILTDQGIIGSHIIHAWFSKEEGENILWYGKIVNSKKIGKIMKYKVSYWLFNESCEDDAVDYLILPAALAADFLSADLSFISNLLVRESYLHAMFPFLHDWMRVICIIYSVYILLVHNFNSTSSLYVILHIYIYIYISFY